MRRVADSAGRGPCGRGGRRRGTPPLPGTAARRLRPRGYRSGNSPQPAGRAHPRRQHDQPADRQECVSLARRRLLPQGAGGLVHGADRGDLGQAPDHGSLSQPRRDRHRHLWRQRRRAAQVALAPCVQRFWVEPADDELQVQGAVAQPAEPLCDGPRDGARSDAGRARERDGLLHVGADPGPGTFWIRGAEGLSVRTLETAERRPAGAVPSDLAITSGADLLTASAIAIVVGAEASLGRPVTVRPGRWRGGAGPWFQAGRGRARGRGTGREHETRRDGERTSEGGDRGPGHERTDRMEAEGGMSDARLSEVARPLRLRRGEEQPAKQAILGEVIR